MTSRLVASQHARSSFNSAFDDWNLTFVELELDEFPTFSNLPSKLSFYGSLKVFPGQRASYVQPGCTLELLPVPSREFRQLHTFSPPNLLEFLSGLWRQVLMD